MNDTGLDTVEAVYEAGKQGQWALVSRAFAADGMLGDQITLPRAL